MPSTVVRMNPLGLFGPGESMRAMIPAIKPTMMIQRMPLMSVVPYELLKGGTARRCRRRAFASNPACQFVLVRARSGRRQRVDDVGQILAETAQQFIARQTALCRQRVDLVGAERVG